MKLFNTLIRCALSVFLLCVLVIGTDTLAQGVAGALPEPIAARDLDNYANRLQLSDEQRRAQTQFHETYRIDFAELREKEPETFASFGSGGGFSGMSLNFDREGMVQKTKLLRKVLNKIRSLDDRFFSELQGTLTESQLEMLPRIKLTRERARYQCGATMLPTMLNSESRIDLSAMVDRLSLPLDQMQALEPHLMPYEMRLTKESKKLYDASVNAGLNLYDYLEAQGVTAETFSNPEQIEGNVFDKLFEAMNTVTNGLNQQAAKIADLNWRTLKHLTPALPEDDAARLSEQYYQRCFPEIMAQMSPVNQRFRFALEHGSLADQQRDQIVILQQDYRQRLQSVCELGHKLEQNTEGGGLIINPTPEQEEAMEKRHQARERWMERGHSLSEQIMASLDALLGEDLARQVDSKIAQYQSESGEEETTQTVQTVMIFSASVGEEGGMSNISTFTSTFEGGVDEISDPFGRRRTLPQPISKPQVGRYAKRLDLDSAENAIIASVHDDYREKFDLLEQNEYAEVRDAEDNHWREDPETAERIPPTESDIDRLYQLRRQAVKSALSTDEEFFDNVKLVVEDDQRVQLAERLKQARLRDIYRSALKAPSGMFSMGGGGMMIMGAPGSDAAEDNVDLSQIVGELELSDEATAQIDPVLLDYELEVTDIFRQSFEVSLRIEETIEKVSVQSTTVEDGRVERELSSENEHLNAMEELWGQDHETRRKLIETNRTARDQIMEVLDVSSAEQFRRAYNKAAFPQIYRKQDTLSHVLAQAMSLPDLTADQRARLGDIVAHYHNEYDSLCEQMVEAQSGGSLSGEEDGWDFSAMQQRAQQIESLKFQRNDLNDRIMAELRLLLTDEQIRRLGLTETEE